MAVYWRSEVVLKSGYIYGKAPQQVCELPFTTEAVQIPPSADEQAAMLICPFICVHTEAASHRQGHCTPVRDVLHKNPDWSGAVPL